MERPCPRHLRWPLRSRCAQPSPERTEMAAPSAPGARSTTWTSVFSKPQQRIPPRAAVCRVFPGRSCGWLAGETEPERCAAIGVVERLDRAVVRLNGAARDRQADADAVGLRC